MMAFRNIFLFDNNGIRIFPRYGKVSIYKMTPPPVRPQSCLCRYFFLFFLLDLSPLEFEATLGTCCFEDILILYKSK